MAHINTVGAGKGSVPRRVDLHKYDEGYDRIFNKTNRPTSSSQRPPNEEAPEDLLPDRGEAQSDAEG